MKRGFGTLAAVAASISLGLSMPVSAQMRTDGVRFLEAVKKRDGDTVLALLGEPGTTVVNSRDLVSGQGPLHIVAARRDLTWLLFLLQHGANPNIADKNGVTPLQIAAQLGFVDGIDALAKGGATVDVVDSTGETPLMAAVHRRDLATVRILLDNGASSSRADSSGRSAREYAQELSNGQSILDAMDAADKKKGGDKSYGPS